MSMTIEDYCAMNSMVHAPPPSCPVTASCGMATEQLVPDQRAYRTSDFFGVQLAYPMLMLRG
jgi:hypothetical protein